MARVRVNKIRAGKNVSGMTLVEAMIAIFICSLLFVLLLSVYGSFVKMSNFQKSSSDLETQFMLVIRVIEKDIHLAGFGIPGNGLHPKNIGADTFRLVVLANEDNAQTTLFQEAGIGDPNIKVKNAQGISANQWVCLVKGPNIASYAIGRVGLQSGSDTIVFKDSLVHTVWKKDSTQVYFAKGIQYGVEMKNRKKSLVRTSLINAIPVGASIDTFIVCPKDKAGADLGGNYAPAKILGITLGGHVGAAGKTIAVTKSFDVDLRNSF
jgi:type II secretory pathway pseudopilin PulG